jgi:hypothetical protein
MNFDYNLEGLVDKNLIRIANNTLIKRSDELWVFGSISDGVLIEIYLAKKFKKEIRFFAQKKGTFQEVTVDDVILEDVSEWLWQYVLSNSNLERWHPRLRFNKTYPLVYPAYSKRNFYWQMHISQFCLNKKTIPLNPFMLFRYFLGDSVSRKSVYTANNSIVRMVDEIWVFGEISDGVLAEITMKKNLEGRVRYFSIVSTNPVVFRKIPVERVQFEETSLEAHRNLL